MSRPLISLPGYTLKEELHRGRGTIVVRGTRMSDALPVVVKVTQPPVSTLDDTLRLLHEHTIVGEVRGNAVVRSYGLERQNREAAMILEDFGGVSLAQYLSSTRVDIPSFLRIALQLSTALQEIHDARIVHKDINPSNIIINPATMQVKVTDFGIASRLSSERARTVAPTVLEGTLPYISPEQTGRMNRAVDYRTDFYSLGITLYETLVGWVPFQSSDTMEVLHHHIARAPAAPAELNPAIPKPVSDIIMKLLSKTAEDRYQSARGLRADLEQCLLAWQESGTIGGFELATSDVSEHLHVVQKLYGREEQVAALIDALDKTFTGGRGLFLVSGDAGIGKSALVNEVHKPIVRQRGLFVSGKFDQFRADTPYAPLIQAMRELIDQLLTSPGGELERWATLLREALGPNGGVLSRLVPEIELLIGEQVPPQELPPQESRQRFVAVFQRFAHAVATKEHPVVFLLDDLQWADPASLELIQQVLADSRLGFFLLIGAHRNDESAAIHRLSVVANELEDSGADVRRVSLGPLDTNAVTMLIAESLGLTTGECRPLAELVTAKTAGNPFFVNEFLKSLSAESLLRFAGDVRRWVWNLDEIRGKNITDNVVAMMSGNIRRLPQATQNALQYAACLGTSFRLDTLAGVQGEGLSAVADDLWAAVRDGFIIPLGDTYRYLQSAAESGERGPADDPTLVSQVSFRFAHDRIQQAAYSLIPSGSAPRIHYNIGRVLLAELEHTGSQETIFAAAYHLNLGSRQMSGTSERQDLIRLNLRAGMRAKASAAFAPALQYFAAGYAHSVPEDLPALQRTVRDLLKEKGECEYLTGVFEEAERTFDAALDIAESPAEQGRILNLKVELFIHRSQLDRALETGITALRLLGVPFPVHPGKLAVAVEMLKIRRKLGWRSVAALIDLPRMRDEEPRVAMSILISLFGIAYARSPEFGGLVITRMMSLTLRHGNADVSAYAYGLYGLLISTGFRAYRAGRDLGMLGLRLSERFDNGLLRGRCAFVYGCLHNHWSRSVVTNREFLRDAYRHATENGDLLYASYALSQESIVDMVTGLSLPTVFRNAADHLTFVRGIQHGDIALYFDTAMYWASALMGEAGGEEKGGVEETVDMHLPGNMIDGSPGPITRGRFDEAGYQKRLSESTYTPPRMFHRFAAIQLHCLQGEYEAAHRLAEDSRILQHALIGQVVEAEYLYYRCLAALGLATTLSRRKRRALLRDVTKGERRMRRWAGLAPDNFAHKADLIAAERARLKGETERAMELYDSAIAGARAQGFVQDEGLAYQRAGEFYLAAGRDVVASSYLREARACYASWGAGALVGMLTTRFRTLLPESADEGAGRSTSRSTQTTRTGTQTLDLLSILKASQALSSEIELSRLLERMMLIVLENAGAQRGLLIVEKGERLIIEAEGIAGADPPVSLSSVPLEETQTVAESIIRYVARVRECVVLDDAEAAGQFVADPYVVRQHAKSILCLPVEHQGKVSGILYLENFLSSGVFTPSRTEVLRLLSSQIAVSMENARLYEQGKELARLREEYRLAAKIQKDLLPGKPPAIEGYEVCGTNLPAQTVGGDYFDFVRIDDRHAAICIADVSGKGLPASLLMANLQASFRGQAMLTLSPAECLARVNRLLYESTAAEKFATVFYGILDTQTHRFRYCNGGHETPFLLGAAGACTGLDAGGVALGILESFSYEEGEVVFEPGDVLVMYSDGITEAMNSSHEQFGRARLSDLLREERQLSVTRLTELIVDRVRRHEEGIPQSDDITLVAVQRLSLPAAPA